MSKELPYYNFFPSEWLLGRISYEDYKTQGVFLHICNIYWHKDCVFSLADLKKQFKKNKKEVEILLKEKFLETTSDEQIRIKWLDNQFENITSTSKINSNNGKKGAEKRWGSKKEENTTDSEAIHSPLQKTRQNDSEAIQTLYENNSETITTEWQTDSHIDKIDKIKEDREREERKKSALASLFSEKHDWKKRQLVSAVKKIHDEAPQLYPQKICDDFARYWSEPRPGTDKIKWELEATWDLRDRLQRWLEREKNFAAKPTQADKTLTIKPDFVIGQPRVVHG